MRVFFYLFFLVLATSCHNPSARDLFIAQNQIFDYSLGGQKYAIVVVEDNGVSAEQARQLARQRAAELTIQKGYRYFTILSQQQVQATKEGPAWRQNRFPSNLYQELIIERKEESPNLTEPAILYPALRLTIELHYEKKGHSLDACTLTEC